MDDESIIYVDDAADAHDEELSKKIFNCKVSCYLNLAAAYTNINEWTLCITACNSCLTLDASNVKALWRRAQARLLPPSCGAAEEDLVRDTIHTLLYSILYYTTVSLHLIVDCSPLAVFREDFDLE